MKLSPKITFSELHIPSLALELGAGKFLFVDKELVGVVEFRTPSRVLVFHRKLLEDKSYFVVSGPA